MAAEIYIGPAGWAYRDWEGIVYPTRPRRGFHPAAYLAQFFDLIELNSTFYKTPTAQVVRVWTQQLRAANPRFRFTAKLHQSFTHQRRALASDEHDVRQYLDLLGDQEMLGALLLQFPWSFRRTPENRDYLLDLAGRFRAYPLAVEMRHASWNDGEAWGWMHDNGLNLCNIDQPVIGASFPPTTQITGKLAYIRLHGRNYENWFRQLPARVPGSGLDRFEHAAAAAPETFTPEASGQRYDYLYTAQEVDEWGARLEQIAAAAETVYIVANNHFAGKSVVNALQLSDRLLGRRFEIPPQLLRHYPDLETIDRTPHAARLF